MSGLRNIRDTTDICALIIGGIDIIGITIATAMATTWAFGLHEITTAMVLRQQEVRMPVSTGIVPTGIATATSAAIEIKDVTTKRRLTFLIHCCMM
jgi:hypothetical protein